MVLHYSRLSSTLPLPIVPYTDWRDCSRLSAAFVSIWHDYITPTTADSKVTGRETAKAVDLF
jgi:hypothetical protein